MRATNALLEIALHARLSQRHAPSELKLVELFALPGAGKSTVVEGLIRHALFKTRQDLSAEWADSSTLQRAGHIGRSGLSHRTLGAAARFGLTARLHSRESLFRLARLVAKTEWLRSRTGTVFLDQGFLQDLWSIFLSSESASADPESLSNLIRSLYDGIETTIVLIDVKPEIATARVLSRTYGDSRFDNLPERQTRRSIEAASGLLHQITDAARLAGLTVHVIDGSPPAEVVTRQLQALFPTMPLRGDTEDPAHRLRRISVVGATGSGKTMLAKALAAHLKLPYWELDETRHAMDQGSSESDFRARVAELALGDSWIIDGHYREVRHLIWRRAEMVVWLNYPLRIIITRLMHRYLLKRSAQADRPGESEPASHHPDASWGRRVRRLGKTLRERNLYGRLLRSEHPGVKVVELKSVSATRQWLRSL